MKLLPTYRAVGLDIGMSSTKRVVLTTQGKQVAVLLCDEFDTREEGILGESELYSSVAEWLNRSAGACGEVFFGLPQFLATTQLSDFPPGVTTGLEEMVAFQTRQLGGLSEESFIHDYQVLAPGFGRSNPVLMGICRESAVREKAEALTTAGVPLSDLFMNGIGVLACLFELHPEIRAETSPQLVLDLGATSTTVAVTAGGQILFVSSLLFGSDNYTNALSKHLGVDAKEAERVKRESRLVVDDTGSPLYQVTRQLENELRSAIEDWRAQESGEIAEAMFSRVWLSGGGAQFAGLAEHLALVFDCPAQAFGPMDYASGSVLPAYATAFGLALQGLGRAAVSLSLGPRDIRWQTLRRHRFSYLVAAAACVTVLMALWMFGVFHRLSLEKSVLQREMAKLDRCEQLIPRVMGTMSAIKHYEKMVLPFVATGNRAGSFIRVLTDLTDACGENDWLVYVADEAVYQRGKGGENVAEQRDVGSGRPASTSAAPSLFRAKPAGIGDVATPDPFPYKTMVDDIEPVSSVIVAGYTLLLPEKPYEPVREIVRKLNDSPCYTDVDLLPEIERIGREDIFECWLAFFRQHPEKRYKAFSLRLPFTEPVIRASASPTKQTGSR